MARDLPVRVQRLGDGRVLLQVADRWHLVLIPPDAVTVGMMLETAGRGAVLVDWQGETLHVEDAYCAECGHVHTGPELDGICIGCACQVRANPAGELRT